MVWESMLSNCIASIRPADISKSTDSFLTLGDTDGADLTVEHTGVAPLVATRVNQLPLLAAVERPVTRWAEITCLHRAGILVCAERNQVYIIVCLFREIRFM